jgi:cytochrome P450
VGTAGAHDGVVPGHGPAIPPAGIEAAAALWTYFADLIADRGAHRRDDLASALLDAADGDDRLNDSEITGVLFLLVSAGAETTTHLIGNAWHAAWLHPDQRSMAFGGRIADWVEETLRFDAPSQGIGRTLTEELSLHGVPLPAGARLFLLIGAANRDPDVFPDPDRFDLDRRTRPLVSFGDGRHYCLGANLARLEARVALEELTALIRDYDIDEATATRVHSAYVRGFNRLPTSVTRR